MRFSIKSKIGTDFGSFDADTKEQALDMMAKELGYRNIYGMMYAENEADRCVSVNPDDFFIVRAEPMTMVYTTIMGGPIHGNGLPFK